MSQQIQINPEQLFPQLILQSPLRPTQTLNNITFQQAQEKIQNDLSLMHKSTFYSSIHIHYGVQDINDRANYQELLKRKKEILDYKIQTQKILHNQLKNATSLEQIEQMQQAYEQDLQAISKRENDISLFKFVPKIHIQAKKKIPGYGTIAQEFDRKGWAMLRAVAGYRSPFLQFDKIEFNMESPSINNIRKRNFYQFGLTWTNPIQFNHNSIFVSAQLSSAPIYQHIDEKKTTFSVGYVDNQSKFQLQIAKRFPQLYENLAIYGKHKYYEPSHKTSIKVDKTLEDTIERGDIETGKFSELKYEIGLPFFSDFPFFKAQLNRKTLYDLYRLSSMFSSSTLRSLFQNSNLENCNNFQLLLSQRNQVCDLLENPQLRGFQNDRNPNHYFFTLKSSWKWNVFNYPAIGRVGIIPFLYLHGGLMLQKQNVKKPLMLGSGGMGLSYALSKVFKVELLYAFIQAQNARIRQLSSLQFRISVND